MNALVPVFPRAPEGLISLFLDRQVEINQK
jgi:hypothetical protein